VSAEAPRHPPAGRRPILSIALLLTLCAPIVLCRAGRPALADPDEGRNAEVAREMVVSGDWLTPRLNGAVYLDKPPAYFWAVAVSFRLFGVSERAARLPSALFALVGIALASWFARRHAGPEAGWLAGAILGLSPLYIVFARTVIFDMMLTVCMTAGAMAAFEAMEGDDGVRRIAATLVFAAAGLGTITKGPVALVVPILVAAAWALARRRPGLFARLRPGRGALVYAAIVAPWLLLVSARNPGYLRYAIVHENLQRIAANSFDADEPITFYVPVVIAGLFPWVLYVCGAGVRRLALAIRSGRDGPAGSSAGTTARTGDDRRVLFTRYASLWAGVLFLFLSLVGSKRPSYMLPLAVPVALVAAVLWAGAFRGRPKRTGGDLPVGAVLVAGVTLAIGIFLSLVEGGRLGTTMAPDRRQLLVSHPLMLAMTTVGLCVACLLLLATRRSGRPAMPLVAAILPLVVMAPLGRVAWSYIEATRSSRSVSRFLAPRLAPGDPVICFEEYRPGLSFYLQRPIYLVGGSGRVFTSNYIRMNVDRYRNAPDSRILSGEELRTWLQRDGPRAFVVAPKRLEDALRAQAGIPLRAIYEDGAGGVFVPAAAALERSRSM
jgi:4-amino-4-deoxy-L-arabinose transferase-like glycosyltransferase